MIDGTTADAPISTCIVTGNPDRLSESAMEHLDRMMGSLHGRYRFEMLVVGVSPKVERWMFDFASYLGVVFYYRPLYIGQDDRPPLPPDENAREREQLFKKRNRIIRAMFPDYFVVALPGIDIADDTILRAAADGHPVFYGARGA